MKKKLPQTVFALGLVSFLTDCSSEMIYPLLPAFLASQFGAGALALGLIEGVAEATAAFLKLYSGVWSDRARKKKPFVLVGYGLSGFARPLIGLATSWWGVLVIRFFDRIGKGIRSSPRDSIIAASVDADARGRAFGLQRAMDHAGSVVGPLIASGLLLLPFIGVRHVFLLAAIPAVLAFLALYYFVDEKVVLESGPEEKASIMKLDWSLLTPDFKKLLVALFVFTLGQSTDAFLLLKLNEVGVPASAIALLWALQSIVKMISSQVGGNLSDRFGDRKLMIIGWIFYSAVYFAFSRELGRDSFVALFLLYGLYFGLTEPSERSVVSKLASGRHRGTAFGFFYLVTGVAALPASVLFGIVWQTYGASTAFQMGAVLSLVASVILWSVRPKESVTD